MTGNCEDKGMARGKPECREETTCKEDDSAAPRINRTQSTACTYVYTLFTWTR